MTKWAKLRIRKFPKACLPNSRGAERGSKAGGFGKPAGCDNWGVGRTALRSQPQPGAVEGRCLAAGRSGLPAAAANTGSTVHCVHTVQPPKCLLNNSASAHCLASLLRNYCHEDCLLDL